MDSSGNTQATPTCTPIRNAPHPAPHITHVSATCTSSTMPLHTLSTPNLLHTNNTSPSQDTENSLPSTPQEHLSQESAPPRALRAAADNSSAFEVVIDTSFPSAVAYILVAPVGSSSELHYSTLFSAVVLKANLSAVEVFSGALIPQESSKAGLEIVYAGSAYTHAQHAASGTIHAYIKLNTCSVDITNPLAMVVAAHSPGRGFSTVHVHALNLSEDCVEDSAGQLVGANEGNYTPCSRGFILTRSVCHMCYHRPSLGGTVPHRSSVPCCQMHTRVRSTTEQPYSYPVRLHSFMGFARHASSTHTGAVVFHCR